MLLICFKFTNIIAYLAENLTKFIDSSKDLRRYQPTCNDDVICNLPHQPTYLAICYLKNGLFHTFSRVE